MQKWFIFILFPPHHHKFTNVSFPASIYVTTSDLLKIKKIMCKRNIWNFPVLNCRQDVILSFLNGCLFNLKGKDLKYAHTKMVSAVAAEMIKVYHFSLQKNCILYRKKILTKSCVCRKSTYKLWTLQKSTIL